jgi:RNA polymerase primary sigma factor
MPVHVVETVYKITRVAAELAQENGRKPTSPEISEKLRIPVHRVNELLNISKEPVSLETPVGEDDSLLKDFIEDNGTPSPFEFVMHGDMKEKIDEILNSLPFREEKILRKRFGIGEDDSYTLEEVGQEFDVTRERIRQIEVNAIKRLKPLTVQMV